MKAKKFVALTAKTLKAIPGSGVRPGMSTRQLWDCLENLITRLVDVIEEKDEEDEDWDQLRTQGPASARGLTNEPFTDKAFEQELRNLAPFPNSVYLKVTAAEGSVSTLEATLRRGSVMVGKIIRQAPVYGSPSSPTYRVFYGNSHNTILCDDLTNALLLALNLYLSAHPQAVPFRLIGGGIVASAKKAKEMVRILMLDELFVKARTLPGVNVLEAETSLKVVRKETEALLFGVKIEHTPQGGYRYCETQGEGKGAAAWASAEALIQHWRVRLGEEAQSKGSPTIK